MPSLSLTHQGQSFAPVVDFGSAVPFNLAFTEGLVYHVGNATIADDYTAVTLWQQGQGGVSTFEFGLLLSSQDIFVQLRNDDSGVPEYSLQFIRANVPYYFGGFAGGSTVNRLDGAILVDNTDYADVDQVRVQRNVAADVGDALVSLFLFR